MRSLRNLFVIEVFLLVFRYSLIGKFETSAEDTACIFEKTGIHPGLIYRASTNLKSNSQDEEEASQRLAKYLKIELHR